MRLSGWGRFPAIECRVLTAQGTGGLAAILREETSIIARGNGRSYGDAALNRHATLLIRRHDRLIDFDPQTGVLTCESGVLLSGLLKVFVPLGWFPAVTPGTKLATVGGMIASDVHGKNHHVAGAFTRHVDAIELILPEGRPVTCSRTENAALFAATCGGMGLTGVIASARLRLIPIETAWIRQETVVCPDLDAVMATFEASSGWTYSVAWIDCLSGGARQGRSVVHLGEHARLDELDAARRADPFALPAKASKRVPLDFPGFALNRFTVGAFNAVYYGSRKAGTEFIDYDTYFYPLDSILDWNRMYGAGGFTQYQCVLPKAASAAGLRRLLSLIRAAGVGSFLAVLKLFGAGESGFLSFPMEGYTLAIDFPVRPPTLDTLLELDAVVADHGGRIYLAKDARMSPTLFRKGYPGLDAFQQTRAAIGATHKMSSLLSDRLAL